MSDRFPFERDRIVIKRFLRGQHAQSDYMVASSATLRFLTGDEHVAFISPTDGALFGQLPAGSSMPGSYPHHVLNYIIEQLGLDTPIVRQRTPLQLSHSTMQRWFMDGLEVTPGVPFVLLGPMGLAAWRAANPPPAYTPDKCPSNHWNRGDDICADCGAELN